MNRKDIPLIIWYCIVILLCYAALNVMCADAGLDVYSFDLSGKQPVYMEVLSGHPILGISFIDSLQGSEMDTKLMQLDKKKTWVILVYQVDPEELS